MKIQIIGYAGSGKSTLAKKLAKIHGVPVLHMDSVHWYGDWQERTVEEETAIVRAFLDKNEGWVIDGNYSKVCPERFKESHLTVYLDFNRFYCYRMARRRYRLNKGKSRGDLPCEEKFDNVFKRWILFEGRTKEKRARHLKRLNETSGERVHLKSRRQLDKWICAHMKTYENIND